MTELHIASIPQLALLQKACETLVVVNLVEVESVHNESDRGVLTNEANQATQLADHIRTLIANATADV